MRCGSSTRSTTSASLRSGSAVCLLLGVAGSAAAAPAPLERPPSVASYVLSARLDEARHRVTATGSIELYNYTERELSEVYLHLYMNAFKNDESLFLRSPFGAGRSGQHGTRWGYIDVKRLVTRDDG